LGWDQALMRKYNNTGHFRLLNQLRNELKKDPIIRAKSAATSEPAVHNTKTVEVRPQSVAYQNRNAAARRTEQRENASGSSFRDRLNAIEMR
tara:strand:+ start:381 stop:656 length:276 start_codon:yes stop_codon:yes gene_type:complete